MQFCLNVRISCLQKRRTFQSESGYFGVLYLTYSKVYHMKLFVRPLDLTSVNTIVYHLPDGPSLSLNIDGIEEFIDLELEVGHYCDTSDIDGTLHFFPKGNA